MNTIGKILVILNFVFAVAVGAFLTYDFATRTNWKTAYESLQREVKVMTESRAIGSQLDVKTSNDYKQAALKIETLEQKLADADIEKTVVKTQLESQLAESQKKATDADLSVQKALGDVDRLKVAVKELNDIVNEREKFALKLQDDVKKFRTEALANDALAKSIQSRNEQLLVELQEKTALVAKLQVGAGGATGGANTTITPRKGTEPNPPPTLVKGEVERVDPTNGTLVQISLGTDQGVNKDNTLEAFRKSEGKWLGHVLIVDAYPRYSVGRLIIPPGTTVRPTLKKGDQVASWVSK